MLKYHIQTIELPVAAKSITFSSIPQTFDDLVVVYSTRSDRAGNIDDPVNITFNAASTGYSSRGLVGSGSTAYTEGYGTSVVFAGYMPAGSTTSSTFGNGSATIPNYRSLSSKSVSVDFVSENNATTAYQNIVSSVWTNSAAITSVTVSAQISNLVQFSSASLYGIKRGSDGVVNAPAIGGVVTTSGGYTYHTFTSSGTFSTSRNLQVDCLIVAGGGSGWGNYGGGAGAGGARQTSMAVGANQSFSVLVGAGAAIDTISGGNSSALGVSSAGGGSGGYGTIVTTTFQNGTNGGSGGGGGGTTGSGGVLLPGSGISGEGFAGGSGGFNRVGGGGGGAAEAGQSYLGGQKGGNGILWLNGSYYAGGGGGGGTTRGLGGLGGGGNGTTSGAGQAGVANTGGGGGGGAPGGAGSTGGSGVVIIRYLTPA